MRSADLVEIEVGDRPAIIYDGSLIVSLTDGTLSVNLEVADPAELGGLDPITFEGDAAAIVAAALDSRAAAADPTSASTLAPPPDVAGIAWGRSEDITSVAELIAANEEQSAVYQPLLDAAGVDASRVFITNVSARAADSDPVEMLGNYSAIQVLGSDGAGLRSAIVDWFTTILGEDQVSTEDRNLGGKDVVALSVGAELQGYLYVHGDTAYAVTMPEDAAASVLEALP